MKSNKLGKTIGVFGVVLMMVVGVVLENSAKGVDLGKVASADSSTAASSTTVASNETSEENEADVSTESSTTTEVASEETSVEVENEVLRMDFFERSAAPLRGYYGGDDLMVWRGNKYAATFYTRRIMFDQVESFSDKEIERLEMGYDGYVVTCEGKNYLINDSTEGFLQLEEGSVSPFNVGVSSVAYVMPTNADKTVGDLYFMYIVYKRPILIAKNVVADSCGISNTYGGYNFVYQKYEDGKYSIVKATIDSEAAENKEDSDYTVEETVLVEGNYKPLSYSYSTNHSTLMYVDCDNNDVYYIKDDETKKILTGGYDRYYMDGTGTIFVSGYDVYYYSADLDIDKAVPILHTGLADIIDGKYRTPYGFLDGYWIERNAILVDNDGKEYYLRFIGNDGSPVTAYELPHKLEERGVELYDGRYLSHIEDGVLYIDDLESYDIKTYIMFDQAPVYSTCCNENCDYFFIFTTDGDIYYIDTYEKKVTLIDSGVDFIEETQDYNYAWDYKWTDLVYSKGGKFYCFNTANDTIEETLEDFEGYFIHDGDYTYFQYPDENESRLYYGYMFYPFY